MVNQKIPDIRRVYICANTESHYCRFLIRCLAEGAARARAVIQLTEARYWRLAKSAGLGRLWMRLQMYVLYPLKLLWTIAKSPRGSVFIVTSNTFYAPVLAACWGRVTGRPAVHLLCDLFPDALEAAGSIRPDGPMSRLIGKVPAAAARRAMGVVYLGEFLRRHAERRWGKPRQSQVIPCGDDAGLFTGPENKLPDAPLAFRYGGQLGHMHDAPALVRAVQKTLALPELASGGARFHFYISGSKAAFVKQALAGTAAEVRDTEADGEWQKSLVNFHIGLATVSPAGAAVCLPSKTYAMMAGGLAVLAICPLWSDLARLVLDNEAGWVVSNSPYVSEEELEGPDYLMKLRAPRSVEEVAEEFAATAARLAGSPGEVWRKRQNARRAAAEKYGSAALSKQWRDFLTRALG